MAGYVGDENAELLAIQREEIVEVAGDRAHGEIASRDLHASDAGHCARENRGLDPPRNFEFFVDDEQAMLIGEGAVGRHIAKAADKKQETESFVVGSTSPQTKVGEIAVEHKCTKDRETNGEDAEFPVHGCPKPRDRKTIRLAVRPPTMASTR